MTVDESLFRVKLMEIKAVLPWEGTQAGCVEVLDVTLPAPHTFLTHHLEVGYRAA